MERRPINRSSIRRIAIGLTVVSAASAALLPTLLLSPWPLTWAAVGLGFFAGLAIGPGAAIGALITFAVYWEQGVPVGQRTKRLAAVLAVLVPQAAFFAWFLT